MRRRLALTNSPKARDLILAAADEEFTSVSVELIFNDRDGWYEAITVDADEYKRWITP